MVGKICDRVAVVNNGTIMDVVDTKAIGSQEEMEELFLKLTGAVK